MQKQTKPKEKKKKNVNLAKSQAVNLPTMHTQGIHTNTGTLISMQGTVKLAKNLHICVTKTTTI